MSRKAFDLREPAVRTTSVVFASPHSGRDYSWAFLRRSVLDERTIRSSEDAFVDQIFAHADRSRRAAAGRAWRRAPMSI